MGITLLSNYPELAKKNKKITSEYLIGKCGYLRILNILNIGETQRTD